MKILVTGGAGFIGSHLVDRFIEQGDQVVIVDDLSTGHLANLNSKARFYKTDIRDAALEGIFREERPDIVSHHAAQMDVRRSVRDPLLDISINIVGTVNVLQQCAQYGVQKIVFASSGGAVYGEPEIMPVSESHQLRATSPYGINKGVGDEYLRYFFESAGLPYVSLRYANVYGPRQDSHGEAGVVAIFTEKMLQGEQPIVNGTGEQTRDFIHVDDVVDANLAALRSNRQGIYNVGTGRETSILELFRMLAAQIAPELPTVYGPAKPGEQMRIALDCSKIYRDLGWRAGTGLEAGLARTVAYYRAALHRDFPNVPLKEVRV